MMTESPAEESQVEESQVEDSTVKDSTVKVPTVEESTSPVEDLLIENSPTDDSTAKASTVDSKMHDDRDEEPTGADAALAQEILMRLECCSCCAIVPAPIQQCSNGHLICHSCRINSVDDANNFKCPSCPASNSLLGRNLVLEELVASCMVKCKRCGKEVQHAKLATHLDFCKLSRKGLMGDVQRRDSKEDEEKKESPEEGRGEKVMKDILQKLYCLYCNEIAPSPVMQCQNGHVACSMCLQRLRHTQNLACPSCQVSMRGTQTRNIHLEEMAEGLVVPCRFAPVCDILVKHSNLADHLAKCEHQPVRCINCKVETKFVNWDLLWKHYQERHLPELTPTELSCLKLDEARVTKMLTGKLKFVSWGHCMGETGSAERILPTILFDEAKRIYYISIRKLGPLTKEYFGLVVTSPSAKLRMEACLPAVSYRARPKSVVDKPCFAISHATMKAMVESGDGTIHLSVSVLAE